MNALQTLPVLEPDNVLSVDYHSRVSLTECLADKSFNLLLRVLGQPSRRLVLVDQELCPHYKVLDFVLDKVWPVVVQYQVV